MLSLEDGFVSAEEESRLDDAERAEREAEFGPPCTACRGYGTGDGKPAGRRVHTGTGWQYHDAGNCDACGGTGNQRDADARKAAPVAAELPTTDDARKALDAASALPRAFKPNTRDYETRRAADRVYAACVRRDEDAARARMAA